MRAARKLTAILLITTTATLSAPIPAQAGMVGTDWALSADESTSKSRLLSVLHRAEVQAQLAGYGVSVRDVEARVAAMTDAEAAHLAANIDEQPAGGIVGAIVLVFLVLLLTDILGYTKIFPFTRPIK